MKTCPFEAQSSLDNTRERSLGIDNAPQTSDQRVANIVTTCPARIASIIKGAIMPVDTLLTATVELMVIGMGTVFIILGLLIACMNMLCLFAPAEEPVTSSCNDEKPVIAAIQTAIHHYRNQSAHKSVA